MATRSNIFLWKIPCTEKPGGLQSLGVTKGSDSTEHKHMQLVSQTSFLQTYSSSSLFQGDLLEEL